MSDVAGQILERLEPGLDNPGLLQAGCRILIGRGFIVLEQPQKLDYPRVG